MSNGGQGYSGPLYEQSSASYQCSICGAWAVLGQLHTCWQQLPPGNPAVWVNPPWADLTPLLEELRAIRKLLEGRIL
jgi:hypothetical protein